MLVTIDLVTEGGLAFKIKCNYVRQAHNGPRSLTNIRDLGSCAESPTKLVLDCSQEEYRCKQLLSNQSKLLSCDQERRLRHSHLDYREDDPIRHVLGMKYFVMS